MFEDLGFFIPRCALRLFGVMLDTTVFSKTSVKEVIFDPDLAINEAPFEMYFCLWSEGFD
jgi:hypothetical protein